MLLLSRNGSPDDARRHAGDKATRGIAAPASAPHDDAVVGFSSTLGKASKDIVEEMRQYEKKFLKEIKEEAGKIMQSFLNL
ncbi:hypothetical protein F4818DRAFT_109431 [Hypoxylon cercidicola]|nr:hypothetical protein F4818DRAFT_109431 [Hypoxylon cercidicola]